ncbi:MAG: M1 family metallopeptidase [Flavobacteriia bacterium]|nr:M1 family metallopeptidase [Flavobacteriia bacterium]
MKKRAQKILFLVFLSLNITGLTQVLVTNQDSLRGTLNENRTWWNVKKYFLNFKVNEKQKSIVGENVIDFSVLFPGQIMQIDLQTPMQIDSVKHRGVNLATSRFGNIYLIDFSTILNVSSNEVLAIYFSGKPKEAQNAPWDGGWIWSKDKLNRPWISVACQGLGASSWYPCKDHQSDEPELGAEISIICDSNLVAISNGRENGTQIIGECKKYSWKVINPINNYNIVPYIGKYVNWKELYNGEKGILDCSYWVLDYELEKATKQFEQVPKLLKSFEYWFGPYPFYEDSYKIVQAPFLGMEHQSAIAYGNRFKNGYLGRDLSATGIGLRWDFILIHESGHEWFGNNITSKDIADMWIHESFTNYSETLFTTSEFGVQKGNKYVIGTRKLIKNDIPVVGEYGVNKEGSGDMYYKGANMLHTIRQIVNDDEKFRKLLRGLNEYFYHQTVTTDQIEKYINQNLGIDLTCIFNQYLRTVKIPNLVFYVENNSIYYKWDNCVENFKIPVKLNNGEWISPSFEWQRYDLKWYKQKKLEIDSNFYVFVRKIKKV